jgi:hypothetical protein
MSTDIKPGLFRPQENQAPDFTARPFKDYKKYTLEPKTESRLQESFVLDANVTYFIQWILQGKQKTWRKLIRWIFGAKKLET